MTAQERLIDALRNHGSVVDDRNPGKVKAQCPAHDDTNPSLSVGPRRDGKGVVVKCHAGCEIHDVLQAINFTMGDLFDEDAARQVFKPYRDYRYPDGRVVHRKPNKQFPQTGNLKGNSLFHADRIGDSPTVYVTEGEKCAEAIEAFTGEVAVSASMGAGKAHYADWSPLRGKDAIIVADRDEPGRSHAAQVAELLDGVASSVQVVEAAEGKDAADHLAAGKSLEEFVPLDPGVTNVPPIEPEPVATEEDKQPRRSVAAQLVDLARAHYRLGVTDTDDAFGVTEEHPHIALMLRGGKTGLRAELARRFFADTNTVASQQALADAGMVLEGFAAQQEPQRVHLRVAERDGLVYVDMGDTAGSVIRIGGGRWEIVPTAPVLFRRTKLTGELPTPRPGKGGPRLWEFVGIAEEDRPILLAVLVSALIQVDVPHVILLLLAEQGSAKSTITRILVSLIDPSAVPLRQPPRDPEGWTTAASASWAVALDNLSGDIDGWLSDCLCRGSTGDGSVKRALYTDSDVSVTAFRRCVITNGVDVAPVRGDLAERIATVKLPRITHRRAESEFEAKWEKARPEVFAALLDLAAKVHALLPTLDVPDLPRMADFAKVLAAVDQVMHTDGLARYREQSRTSARDTLDVPFIAELVAAGREFTETTSAELLSALTPGNPDWRRPKGWPKSARAVTGLLTRHAPAMRAQRWRIDHDEAANHDSIIKWTISPPEKAGKEDPPNPPGQSSQVNGRNEGGLRHPEGQSAGQAITRHDVPNPPRPANTKPVSSTNGLAGQAGQQYPPSLVLCGCGVELSRPESIDRGCCAECALTAGGAA